MQRTRRALAYDSLHGVARTRDVMCKPVGLTKEGP